MTFFTAMTARFRQLCTITFLGTFLSTTTAMATMASNHLRVTANQSDGDEREKNRDAKKNRTIHPNILHKKNKPNLGETKPPSQAMENCALYKACVDCLAYGARLPRSLQLSSNHGIAARNLPIFLAQGSNRRHNTPP